MPQTRCEECGGLLITPEIGGPYALCENAVFERGCKKGKLVNAALLNDFRREVCKSLPRAIYNRSMSLYDIGEEFIKKGKACLTSVDPWGKVPDAAWFGGNRGGQPVLCEVIRTPAIKKKP